MEVFQLLTFRVGIHTEFVVNCELLSLFPTFGKNGSTASNSSFGSSEVHIIPNYTPAYNYQRPHKNDFPVREYDVAAADAVAAACSCWLFIISAWCYQRRLEYWVLR